jgi:hypothetical protein
LQVATSFCKAYFLPQGGAAEAATGREGVRDLTRSSPFSQQQPTMTSSVNHDLIILSIILVCFSGISNRKKIWRKWWEECK